MNDMARKHKWSLMKRRDTNLEQVSSLINGMVISDQRHDWHHDAFLLYKVYKEFKVAV